MRTRNRGLGRAIALMAFAMIVNLFFSFQARAGHAPIVFYNVENWYSGTIQQIWQIRFGSPTDAYAIPWDANNPKCANGEMAWRMGTVYPWTSDGHNYQTSYTYYTPSNCAYVGSQPVYPSNAIGWAFCSPSSYENTAAGFTGGRCPAISPDPEKNRGPPRYPAQSKSDPVNPATGNKFSLLTVFRGTGGFPLDFSIAYNSQSGNSESQLQNELVLGQQVVHSYLRTVRIQSNASLTSAYVLRPDGKVFGFDQSGTSWVGDADVSDTLVASYGSGGAITGWTYTTQNGSQENYSASGQLTSLVQRGGLMQTLAYNANGQLGSVTDPQGRSLTFAYDTSGRIQQMTAPDGQVYGFSYDANDNLQVITYPDTYTLQWLHENSTGVNDLTGVIDENNVRTDTTQYNSPNSTNQVTLNEGAGGINATTFSYANPGNGTVTETVTNPLGMVETTTTQYLFGIALPAKITQACTGCTSSSRQYTYDSGGYTASFTDFNGNQTLTQYNDTTGLLDQVIEASGTSQQRTTTVTWNAAFRVPLTRQIQNAQGTIVAEAAWVYNALGALSARCDIDPTNPATASYTCAATGTPPAGVRRWTYTYCAAVDTVQCPVVGLLLSVVGPRTDVSQVWTYSYYMQGNANNSPGDLQSITDPLGHTTTYLTYDGAGRVKSLQDANGVVTNLTYTARGWLASRSVGGATTTLGYTPYGAIASLTDPDGVITTLAYDSTHRLTDIFDAQGNDLHYTLDAAGNKTAEQILTASGTVVQSQSRSYNPLSELTARVDGLNQTVFTAGYSDSYDGDGNPVHSADALSFQHHRSFDALNRLTSTIDNYNGTDPATTNTTTTVSLDALDRLAGFTDPTVLATGYTYDGLNDPTQLQSPDTGTSTDTYDAAGNRITHTDAKAIVSTSTFDALNRVISTSYVAATLNVNYTYDEPNTVTGCSASSPIGRLTRVVEGVVTTVFCYDGRGNIIQKMQMLSGYNDITNYGYTAADRLIGVSVPDQTAVSYTYNTNGRVSGVQVTPSGATTAPPTVVSNISYLPFGPISSYTLGNGQAIVRTYDANYRLTDLTSPALALHFARDAMGNIVALGNAPGANPAMETYSYDSLYRLTGINDAGTALESYTYNQTGDRLSKTAPGLATGAYLYTAGTHQLASIGNAARINDVDGNTTASVIGGNTYGFGYNGRNRMTVVQLNGQTVANYTYNALGERIGKVASFPQSVSERYGYNEAGQLIGEYGTTSRDYIWLGDIPVAVVDNTISGSVTTSTVNYVTADQLGTPRAVSTNAGVVIWSWAYQGNPFGEQQPTSTTGYVLNLRYPGQYYDAESGTNYNFSRNYEPAIGGYQQSDPWGLFGGQMSTYAYAGGNPLDHMDPLGLADVNVWDYRGSAGEGWGHASMGLADGEYISWWPQANGRDSIAPGLPVLENIYDVPANVDQTYDGDFDGEGGMSPTRVIHLDNLDENAIASWWASFKKSHKWKTLSQNCSTTVAEALEAGGADKHLIGYPKPMYWTPADVRAYAEALKAAGSGQIIYTPREH